MWSRSLYHSILDDHKPAIQINLEHLAYGRVCPVNRMKLRSARPHESESRGQAASAFGSGVDNFTRETTRAFKISSCLQSLPFLTLRAAPTYETQPFHGCRKPADAAPATNRGQVIDKVLGTVFVSSGLTACAIAAIRPGRGVRILVCGGVWSAMYGLQTLDQAPLVLAALPHALQSTRCVTTAVTYLLLVSALCA
jgi:hypothetical protein